jgi:hypothetical protein
MSVFSAATGLAGTFQYYLPLIVIFVGLAVVLLVFKLAGVKSKVLWWLFLNSLIGVAMFIAFDAILDGVLHMNFFRIAISWFTAGFVGVLGVPGVILLLLLRYLVRLP